MPLAEMQADASNAYVGRLLTQGYTYNQVLSRLARRYPNESLGERSRAASSGLASWRAASHLEALGAAGQLQPQEFAAGGTAGQGFRYYTTVELIDPQSGEPLRRSVEVYSPTNLTLLQVAEQAQGILSGALPPARGRGRSPDDPPNLIFANLNVVAVERA